MGHRRKTGIALLSSERKVSFSIYFFRFSGKTRYFFICSCYHHLFFRLLGSLPRPKIPFCLFDFNRFLDNQPGHFLRIHSPGLWSTLLCQLHVEPLFVQFMQSKIPQRNDGFVQICHHFYSKKNSHYETFSAHHLCG